MSPTLVTDSILWVLGYKNTSSPYPVLQYSAASWFMNQLWSWFFYFLLTYFFVSTQISSLSSPAPDAGLVFKTIYFVWIAHLPELWLKMAACLALFLLSASLHLAHLTPLAFPHPSSQAQSGPGYSPCLLGLVCNLPTNQYWNGRWQRRRNLEWMAT